MSLRWPNSIVNKTFTTPSGAQSTPGLWKLSTVAEYVQQALWPQPPTYIEDVFSTYLYTGNGSTQTINNGIDLAGKGGMVWTKCRSNAFFSNIFDTARGINNALYSESTSAQVYDPSLLPSFNSNGFTLGSNSNSNVDGATNVSWTFRKAPKFFDVVTYTGDGVAGRQISHSLGIAPGMIIIKRTDSTGNWWVYHRSVVSTQMLALNTTDQSSAFGSSNTFGDGSNPVAPTSSVFTVGAQAGANASGGTYVAYLFAHDTSSTGLIQCGSFTADGSGNADVTLGWEPQYILVKPSSISGNWQTLDTMRGWSMTGYKWLQPNTADAEYSQATPYFIPTATGAKFQNGGLAAGETYIYMAIRRGPMKTPTDATKVFKPVYSSALTGAKQTTNFTVDTQLMRIPGSGYNNFMVDRLRGVGTTNADNNSKTIITNDTGAEFSAFPLTYGWDNTGFGISSSFSGTNTIYWNFQRAPGFFDVVCYTGTGVARTVNHNLGVAPELMIVKERNASGAGWPVYNKTITASDFIRLNYDGATQSLSLVWNNTEPTSTVFTVGIANSTNQDSVNFVAYLFASCPGVSKVGSYTGTGSTQTISCGFTGGARFVLIKRTDSTGDWWVWDTARGMVSGTDPRLALDTTSAEINADWCYTTTGGFQLVTSDASVNASGGSYIFLAIA